MEWLRRYLLLSDRENQQEVWRKSVLRILLVSDLLFLLLLTLFSSVDAWHAERYRVIVIELSFYLFALGILLLSRRHQRLAAGLLILMLYATGLVILLGAEDPWLRRLGPLMCYCAPLLALLFFGWRTALTCMLFNLLPFWVLLNLDHLQLPELQLYLPSAELYLNTLLFVFISVCLPLAVARMVRGLIDAQRRQTQLHSELRTSQRLYRDQFESVGPALICRPDGHILDINNAARRLLDIAEDAPAGTLSEHLCNIAGQPPQLTSSDEQQDWTPSSARQPQRWLQLRLAHPGAGEHLLITLRDISKLRQLQLDLRSQAASAHQAHLVDPLTGLLNRPGAVSQLREWQLADPQRAIGAIGIRVDDLGYINDTHGMDAGNRFLEAFVSQLRQLIPAEAMLARIKGTTFLVASRDMRPTERTLQRLNQLRSTFPPVLHLDEGIDHRLSLNFGLSFYPDDCSDTLSLIRHSELALKQARSFRHGSYAIYDAQSARDSYRRTELLLRLRRALEHDQFFLMFQPLVDAEGNLHSLEALVRWRDEDGRLIPPDQFIPLAEESELIVEIDQRVLELACAQIARWKRVLGRAPLVAINLSARDIQSPELLPHLHEKLERHGLTPDELELEITESSLLNENRETRMTFARLYEHGFPITLDDFGTGYSSLSRLTELPIGRLKIDRAFLRDLPGNPRQETMVKSIVAMARQMGLALVAEGVETREQLYYLDALGCDSFQGYLFAPPLTVEDIDQRIRAGNLSFTPKD